MADGAGRGASLLGRGRGVTGVLGSARSRAEAAALLAAGIDVLDLKEPARGALGAVAPELAAAVAAAAAGRCRVSAAAGLAGEPELLERTRNFAAAGVDYVKAGFGDAARRTALEAFRAAAAPAGAVAVLFADAPGMRPADWLAPLAAAGFAGVMLDTADKRGRSLPDCLNPDEARTFAARARAAGLLCGLAGRLDLDAALAYLPARPDYLGFRGALCRDAERTHEICPDTARRLIAALSAGAASAPVRPPAAAESRPEEAR